MKGKKEIKKNEKGYFKPKELRNSPFKHAFTVTLPLKIDLNNTWCWCVHTGGEQQAVVWVTESRRSEHQYVWEGYPTGAQVWETKDQTGQAQVRHQVGYSSNSNFKCIKMWVFWIHSWVGIYKEMLIKIMQCLYFF